MKLFFDGGWRPSTGMELAVVVGGRVHLERDLGPGSGMEAEWLALLRAATLALGEPDPVLIGDAAAVIAQATGRVRCPPRYRRHLDRLQGMEASTGKWRIRHVHRSRNPAGITLAALHPR